MIGTTTVTVTATDAYANSSTATFDVNVQDTTPPAITFASPNRVAEATSAAGAAVNYRGLRDCDAMRSGR